MVKRTAALLAAALILLSVPAGTADMKWKQDTAGQKILKAYIETANVYLAQLGEQVINSLFEIYPGIAVLGITELPDALTPEEAEITVRLLDDRMDLLQLRVSDTGRFPAIAASLIMALYGNRISREKALQYPEEHALRAKREPGNSFEETVDEMSGTIPRFYYAYYPDQYHDGINWLQMTIVFSKDPDWNGNELINGGTGDEEGEEANGEGEEYEGYFPEDPYSHLETFATPTPEPESAAGEYDFR